MRLEIRTSPLRHGTLNGLCSRGINIGSKVRFTPRGGRVRKANPIRYLKRGSGNPSGMQKIAWECGRMRPASRVDRRDRLHFTPGALGPAKEPNKPDIRPKTATAKSQARFTHWFRLCYASRNCRPCTVFEGTMWARTMHRSLCCLGPAPACGIAACPHAGSTTACQMCVIRPPRLTLAST